MALMPVCIGRETLLRSMTPGAGLSMGRVSCVTMSPRPSIGWPRAFTTRPISASPTGTSVILPVRRTQCPCSRPSKAPSRTTPTLFFSRSMTMPRAPLWNSSSSPAMASEMPETRQIPSDTLMTVPVW